MRLHVLSDLHTEFEDFSPPRTDADVVVLAGDIGIRDRGVQFARRAFPKQQVVYVAGNHEYYGRAIPHHTEKMRAAAKELGIHFLDEEAIIIDGVRFLGATLWTDFALLGEDLSYVAMYEAQERMTDFRRIRRSPSFSKLRPIDARALHRRARAWLRAVLEQGHDGPTVVVTHHAPHILSLEERQRDVLLSAAYASDLTNLLDGRASLWIHGHTHRAVDYVVGGTRVVSNQRGYPDEPADGFEPGFVLDIG